MVDTATPDEAGDEEEEDAPLTPSQRVRFLSGYYRLTHTLTLRPLTMHPPAALPGINTEAPNHGLSSGQRKPKAKGWSAMRQRYVYASRLSDKYEEGVGGVCSEAGRLAS